jgi:hypothetical protein
MRIDMNLARRGPSTGYHEPVPHSLSSLGRPGLPSALQRFVDLNTKRYGMRGLGSTADQIIAQYQQEFAPNNPFVINNPSLVQDAAGTVINALNTYCANNPGDASSCNGSVASSSYIAQANQIAAALPPALVAAAQAGQTTPIATPNTTTANNPGPIISQATENCFPLVGYTWVPGTGCMQNAYVPGATTAATTFASNPPAQTTATSNIVSGGGSGTQGGGSNVLGTAPQSAPPPVPTGVLPNQPTVQNSNVTGSATGTSALTTGGTNPNLTPGTCALSFFPGETCLAGAVGSKTAMLLGAGVLALFLFMGMSK